MITSVRDFRLDLPFGPIRLTARFNGNRVYLFVNDIPCKEEVWFTLDGSDLPQLEREVFDDGPWDEPK